MAGACCLCYKELRKSDGRVRITSKLKRENISYATVLCEYADIDVSGQAEKLCVCDSCKLALTNVYTWRTKADEARARLPVNRPTTPKRKLPFTPGSGRKEEMSLNATLSDEMYTNQMPEKKRKSNGQCCKDWRERQKESRSESFSQENAERLRKHRVKFKLESSEEQKDLQRERANHRKIMWREKKKQQGGEESEHQESQEAPNPELHPETPAVAETDCFKRVKRKWNVDSFPSPSAGIADIGSDILDADSASEHVQQTHHTGGNDNGDIAVPRILVSNKHSHNLSVDIASLQALLQEKDRIIGVLANRIEDLEEQVAQLTEELSVYRGHESSTSSLVFSATKTHRNINAPNPHSLATEGHEDVKPDLLPLSETESGTGGLGACDSFVDTEVNSNIIGNYQLPEAESHVDVKPEPPEDEGSSHRMGHDNLGEVDTKTTDESSMQLLPPMQEGQDKPRIHDMEFLPSIKGSPKLCYDGYIYIKNKTLAKGGCSYECHRRRSKFVCKGRVRVNGNTVTQVIDHTHEPEKDKIASLRVMTALKLRARTTDEPPQQIMTNLLTPEMAAKMPNMETIRRSIRRYRHAASNPLPQGQEGAPYPLPAHYHGLDNQEQFLLYDSGGDGEDRSTAAWLRDVDTGGTTVDGALQIAPGQNPSDETAGTRTAALSWTCSSRPSSSNLFASECTLMEMGQDGVASVNEPSSTTSTSVCDTDQGPLPEHVKLEIKSEPNCDEEENT